MLYNAESFSRTTAQDTYYVSISRERHAVTVFTDDAEKLPERVDRQGYKGLAHDLVQSQIPHPVTQPHDPQTALDAQPAPALEIE
ncbi:hypothetical protein GCM10009125_05000 [Castellaniella daejeonensis]|uniref:Uncharacterized protein n=1 Tax=Castellaniella daejeonensis TaxID=659013 RepID=A0ABN0TDM3_9BURK